MSATVALWLPDLARLVQAGAAAEVPTLHRWLARGTSIEQSRGVLARYVDLPGEWPVAALTRSVDADDAARSLWVRADPAHLRAGISSAHLLAIGRVGIDADEAQAFRRSLAPMFGDAGFELSTPHPERWYLRLPEGAKVPTFVPPDLALGADLRTVLPQGDESARWLRLMNESQVVLHQHEVNRRRAQEGRVSVNSVWFWGAGRLPSHVTARFARAAGDDALLGGIAMRAGARRVPLDEVLAGAQPGLTVIDARAIERFGDMEHVLFTPLARQLRRGEIDSIDLELGETATVRVTRADRWRFWRRLRQAW
jgi:hypothetical protein